MRLAPVTRTIILLCIVALAGWTTVAAIWGLPGDTVSEHILAAARRFPMVTLAAGILVGHWFWPQHVRG